MQLFSALRSPFRLAVRVYCDDTNAGGIVFCADDPKFFERPRTGWRRALAIGQQAWHGTELLAEGDIRIGCVDAQTLRPRPIPSTLLDRLA
jgi:acyl-CoA thioester hydrolase